MQDTRFAIVCRLTAVGLFAALLGGCSSDRSALAVWVGSPKTEVEALELLAASPAATTGRLVVKLTNPNDVPLPLPLARYTVTLGGVTYATDTVPNATVPANGEQRIVLPVVFENPAGPSYSASGSVTYVPPGEIRMLLTDLGIPLPSARFKGAGESIGTPKSVEVIPVEPIEQEPSDNAVDEAVEAVEEAVDEMTESDDDSAPDVAPDESTDEEPAENG